MNKPVAIFIFGGTGDLARRKLYPVLESLYRKGKLKDLRGIYALGRSEEKIGEYMESYGNNIVKFLRFIKLDVSNKEDYLKLSEEIENLRGVELIFYLALPPSLFEAVIVNLGSILRKFSNPRKIVIEKPFGFDLESAKRLNFQLRRYFTEREIYRIDHFLGKIPIQNILSMRFSNYIFEGIWNKNFIDSVQISALEEVGLEGRVSYYDSIGALRDMIQNHLIQMMSFLAMEPPAVMSPERIRDEKVKVLASIRRFDLFEIDRFAVRGQYRGYREELGRDSNTETFAAVKLMIENFRWEGVPFYLRTGKRLKRKITQAVVVFKEIPGNFGKLLGCLPEQNKIAFGIAPDTKVKLSFQLMPPKGFLTCTLESMMEVDIAEQFGGNIPEAYETLMEDILEGDQTLFIREDESELAWEIVQPILEAWREGKEVPLYEPGGWGPKEAEEFIRKDGRRWILV